MGFRYFCRRAYAWGQTILGRSILFSLAMLLLTLLMAGLVTHTSQNALRDEIVKRNTAQAEAVVEQLALSLGKTMDIQRGMLYDTDLNRLGVAPGYYSSPQRIMAMLRAVERMRILTSSSPLIDQSFFMAPAIGKTITADGVEAMDEAGFGRFSGLCAGQQTAFAEQDGQFYILMAYPIYSSYLKENGPSYLLGLKLDQKAITALLSSHLSRKDEYVTRSGQPDVPLSAEAEHARNYAMIQDMRFSNRIRLRFPPLPGDMKDIIVPKLILQPLLENAYQHGLKETMANGLIDVRFQKTETEAVILVEDNGKNLTDEALESLKESLENPDVQETTGLINIHRRLRLRFGAPYGLSFNRGESGGLLVKMLIPASERRAADAPGADCG